MKMNDQQYLTVMSKLKFISSVGENQFLNVTGGYTENKNVFTRGIRKLYNLYYKQTETGIATAIFCRDVILDAFKLLDKYTICKERHSENHQWAKTIQRYIEEANIGITHLKETHKSNNYAYALFDSLNVAIAQRINGNSCCGERGERED